MTNDVATKLDRQTRACRSGRTMGAPSPGAPASVLPGSDVFEQIAERRRTEAAERAANHATVVSDRAVIEAAIRLPWSNA